MEGIITFTIALEVYTLAPYNGPTTSMASNKTITSKKSLTLSHK